MKNSLIPKKEVVSGKNYWCQYNDSNVLILMKYSGNGTFDSIGLSVDTSDIRVMFEGYVSINKTRIPHRFLLPKRHYWCSCGDENKLTLMRYDNDKSFYSSSHDASWPLNSIKVVFEDYEH